MGLEQTAQGFGEKVVQAARSSFGDERLGLGGESGWQLGLDAGLLHTANLARLSEWGDGDGAQPGTEVIGTGLSTVSSGCLGRAEVQPGAGTLRIFGGVTLA